MLRPYQVEQENAVVEHIGKGVYRQLISAATGTGKMILAAHLIGRLKTEMPGQALFLAHRDLLITQAAKQLKKWNPDLSVAIDMGAQRADPNVDVIVSCVATLGRKGSSRIERFDWSRINKCITDECHRSLGQTYKNVYEYGGFFAPDAKKLLLGITATSVRGDGKALAEVYDKIVHTYSLRQAIQAGWLVDVRGLRVRTATSLEHVSTSMRDFKQDELADAVNNPTRNQLIVKAWLDNAKGMQTIAFTVNVAHAQDLAAMFVQYGVNAIAVWGDDPDRERKVKLLYENKVDVVCNAQLLVEGVDVPTVSCVILAKPSKSPVFVSQAVGRATRLQEGTGNLHDAVRAGISPLKTFALILDVVDTYSKHSLVTLPSLLGMNAQLDLKGKSLVGAAIALEHAQEEHPHIDFSKLEDIDGIAPLVESVNLWDIKYPTEVTENSELSWHATMDGAFALLMPAGDSCYIRQNAFERWETTAVIEGKRYRGERDSLEEMFRVADALVMDKGRAHLKILRQTGKEKWHNNPASEPQLRKLRQFYKGRQIPPTLTSGVASKLISDFLAKRQTARA
jgi:superfamily II DNA or RNA helicase